MLSGDAQLLAISLLLVLFLIIPFREFRLILVFKD